MWKNQATSDETRALYHKSEQNWALPSLQKVIFIKRKADNTARKCPEHLKTNREKKKFSGASPASVFFHGDYPNENLPIPNSKKLTYAHINGQRTSIVYVFCRGMNEAHIQGISAAVTNGLMEALLKKISFFLYRSFNKCNMRRPPRVQTICS